jgi:hypothetical protein
MDNDRKSNVIEFTYQFEIVFVEPLKDLELMGKIFQCCSGLADILDGNEDAPIDVAGGNNKVIFMLDDSGYYNVDKAGNKIPIKVSKDKILFLHKNVGNWFRLLFPEIKFSISEIQLELNEFEENNDG